MAEVITPSPITTVPTPHTPSQQPTPAPGGGGPSDDDVAVRVAKSFSEFLNEFTDEDPAALLQQDPATPPRRPPTPVYVAQLQTLKNRMRTTLYVDYDHLMQFNPDLVVVAEEFFRYEPYLRRCIAEFVAKHTSADGTGAATQSYWLSVYNMPTIRKLRDLRSEQIGELSSISGTVTRTSEVRPELLYGSFECGNCGEMFNNVEQQFRYTEPPMCQSCQTKNMWRLDIEKSTFVDWQRIRLQENAHEIPAGSMPRTMDVILRNDNVESAKAGDKVVLTGTLIVIPDTISLARAGDRVQAGPKGGAAMRSEGFTGAKQFGVRELVYRTAFLACHVAAADEDKASTSIRGEEGDEESFESILQSYTRDEQEEISEMKSHSRLYQKMVSSIAPTVYGHDEVKRGILLMLFGGVHKETREGISLRGDINACIVGDPSTAKSQFLKYVVNFLPRAIYASGKASSAAGLTASVAKDHETGEFCIEAGALMLADNGICCIDEFDKMDLKDQVAIHEAMEQQTISISKAGIQATLNARTSILAAANPIGGRYDRGRTLKQNLTMSAPIMSRFDLFFVVLDDCDESADINVARFIIAVHRGKAGAAGTGGAEFTKGQLQRYIRVARKVNPVVQPEARNLLVESYKRLRQADATGGARSSYRITVRQLESLIRLSEALARMHLDENVRPQYVREAVRLLRKSIIHVETEDVVLNEEEEDDDDEHGAMKAKGNADDPAATNVKDEDVEMGDGEGGDDDDDNDDGDGDGRQDGAAGIRSVIRESHRRAEQARKARNPDDSANKDGQQTNGDGNHGSGNANGSKHSNDAGDDKIMADKPNSSDRGTETAKDGTEAANETQEKTAGETQEKTAGETQEKTAGETQSTEASKGGSGQSPKLTIGYNEFRLLMNKVVVHLRKIESVDRERGAVATRKEMIQFLLEDADRQEGSGGAFDSEEALRHEAKVMRLAVNRMIKHERVLVEIPNQMGVGRDDKKFMVHPNYVVE